MKNLFQISRQQSLPLHTGRQLNVRKMFRRHSGRLLNVVCTFNLCSVSGGVQFLKNNVYSLNSKICIHCTSWKKKLKLRNPILFSQSEIAGITFLRNDMCSEGIKMAFFEYSVNTQLFKINNKNTRKTCKKYSKLIIKTSERRHWRRSSVFIVNFEHTLNFF